jgi:hypothetical protein
MTPQEFVDVIDAWSAAGGAFPKHIAHDHEINTVAETEAVCRALASSHIYAVGDLERPALDHLIAFFQSAETKEAADAFRQQGLPCSGGS